MKISFVKALSVIFGFILNQKYMLSYVLYLLMHLISSLGHTFLMFLVTQLVCSCLAFYTMVEMLVISF
jgi:hypothetical protein